MNFGDVLKKSFLDAFSSRDITTSFILTTLFITALFGLYIYGIYRVVCRRGFYSKSFNNSLVTISLITASIILAIQSSVVISLGMVGALSIVRFRTAIKDPTDLTFLFWSISIGIICGAGFYEIAGWVSLAITVITFLLELIPSARAPKLLILNISCCEAEATILAVIRAHTRNYVVKSRNLTAKGLELILELRIKDESGLIYAIDALEDVSAVSLLSHDGEATY